MKVYINLIKRKKFNKYFDLNKFDWNKVLNFTIQPRYSGYKEFVEYIERRRKTMDKKYQDIHYRNINNEEVFVHRKVSIRDIRFKENHIEIDFTEGELDRIRLHFYGSLVVKTIIIPKLCGHSLIID